MRAKRRSEGTEWGGTRRANADKGIAIAILVAQPIRPYGPYGCTETYANSSMQGRWSPGRYSGLLAAEGVWDTGDMGRGDMQCTNSRLLIWCESQRVVCRVMQCKGAAHSVSPHRARLAPSLAPAGPRQTGRTRASWAHYARCGAVVGPRRASAGPTPRD